jgi:HEAT repeat protein
MTEERKPYQIIDEMTTARSHLSDSEVLAELAAISPLADEDDPCWDTEKYWHQVANPYLALGNIAAERRLKAAIPLMLERACYGDPGEIMRNLCHVLEGIVEPNYGELSEPCLTAARSPRAGTRLWAIFQLKRLREPLAIPILEQASEDPAEEVRSAAKGALEVIRDSVAQSE